MKTKSLWWCIAGALLGLSVIAFVAMHGISEAGAGLFISVTIMGGLIYSIRRRLYGEEGRRAQKLQLVGFLLMASSSVFEVAGFDLNEGWWPLAMGSILIVGLLIGSVGFWRMAGLGR